MLRRTLLRFQGEQTELLKKAAQLLNIIAHYIYVNPLESTAS